MMQGNGQQGGPVLSVPVISSQLKHFRITLAEPSPDDPKYLAEKEYRITADAIGLDNVGNTVIIKHGEAVASFPPAKMRGWRLADFHLSDRDD
jgi:hypothetical protein